MRNSVNASPVRTEANDVRRDLSGIRAKDGMVRSGANTDGVSASSGGCRARTREAIARAGMSHKEFAINCKQPQSVISEALSGSRAINMDWFEAQPESFRLHYHELQREAWNIDGRAEEDEIRAMAERFFGMLFRANCKRVSA